jgi:hypothetical protein
MRAVSEQRLELARDTGDREQEVAALNMLATGAFLGGDLATAQRRYEEALEVARTIENREMLAGTLSNFGRFARDNDDLARSRELLTESLMIDRAVDNELDVAQTVKELAMTTIYEGDYANAVGLLGEGFDIATRLGLSVVLGDLVFAVALLASRMDRPRDATILVGAVDAQDERLGYEHTPELKWWWALRAELLAALGEPAFEEALAEGSMLELESAAARARAFVDTVR